MDYLIYLVEDEPNLNRLLTAYMEKEGWKVLAMSAGSECRPHISDAPHLWVLDIMLPDCDGYQLIQEIRVRRPDMPVIFISARDEEIDRVVGLEMGSDDYVAKPFLPRELIIRIRRLFERIYGLENGRKNQAAAHLINSCTLDESTRTLYASDRSIIDLTAREFDLLLYLVRHAGQALSREQMLESVWGVDYFGTDRVVDDLVRRIRKKAPDLRIETIYGYGYRMVKS